MKIEKTVRIFKAMPTLETERLILRPLSQKDSCDMFDYAHRDALTQYLLWDPHPGESYTHEYLRYVEKRYRAGDFYDWAVVLKENSRMIGTCGFTRIDHTSELGEVGYVINPDYQGNGYATEAAQRVVSFGFETLGLHRMEARFMLGNDASLRVMKKLGMSFEGYSRESLYVKGEYRTVGVCAILDREYYGRK